MSYHDAVHHPSHYTAHPSGVECIQITEHMGFCLGNAIKYIWRADLKADALEDLHKARWYLDREIARREEDARRAAKKREAQAETFAMLDKNAAAFTYGVSRDSA